MSDSAWQAEQLKRCPKGKWRGASMDGLMSGRPLAISALGRRAENKNSGLTAFAYLWRRFGPPWRGSDPHKDLCSYTLTTPNRDVMLRVYPSGSPLVYGVGYMAREHFRLDQEKPVRDWHERQWRWWLAQDPKREAMEPQAQVNAHFDDMMDKAAHAKAVAALGKCPRLPMPKSWRRRTSGPMYEVNTALDAALRDLLRPVWVRDVPINVLGRMSDQDAGEVLGVEQSVYAGYGVSRRALDRLRKGDASDG